uniref:FAD-dependent oxidoreductase n=1 Tax=Roseihalotalea indica TaxID=2867963 RepID=A0AA49GPJ8_9BACT|nr:FAD-dependent oxidoreductase [Tunicatimonas sp. TK19036]
MKHVIIGGSDAGVSAALRIKELAPAHQVTLLLADEYPNYSICGLPFYLSGEVKHWQDLAHRKKADLEAAGITIKTSHRVTTIDVGEKAIYAKGRAFAYDTLLMATGASSVRPPLAGIDQPGVFTLRWMDEMLAIDAYTRQHSVKSVLIVGGGYIGVELADAFTLRGLQTTLVEYAPTVLQTLDAELGEKLQRHMEAKGVQVHTHTQVQSIEPLAGTKRLQVCGTSDLVQEVDMVLVVTGAKPATTLAEAIGLETGHQGALRVNQRMETALPGIYAAGDCAETYHRYLMKNLYLPLGTTAHKQGRIAGENMAGGEALFQGTMGTQVVKVFDQVAARTGLHDRDAAKQHIPYRTVQSEHDDHKAYYPHAQKMTIRITGNPQTGELLGAQILGQVGSEVAKRMDVFATALHHRMKVSELNDLDLSYTPPLSSPWDPVQMAAQYWLQISSLNKCRSYAKMLT